MIMANGGIYDRQKRIPGWNQDELANKRVLIIGAGALGNFVGLELALLGVGHIQVYDHDTIEETNLNRQFLYIDSVGQKKAPTLAERLSHLNPQIDVKGMHMKIDEDTIEYLVKSDQKPDVIVDCLDNFVTRAVLNRYCIENKIPLVSGGTSPMKGQVMVYLPGQTPCLDCQTGDLYERAEAEDESSRTSCIRDPNPSVVTTNGIIGSIMADNVRKVLMHIDGDQKLGGKLVYNGQSANEFGIEKIKKKKDCKC
jgi:adenylyltransferase/sulfurtransferase